MSRKPKKTQRSHVGAIIVLILMMLVFIAGTALMVKLCLDIPNQDVTISSKPGSCSSDICITENASDASSCSSCTGGNFLRKIATCISS